MYCQTCGKPVSGSPAESHPEPGLLGFTAGSSTNCIGSGQPAIGWFRKHALKLVLALMVLILVSGFIFMSLHHHPTKSLSPAPPSATSDSSAVSPPG